MLEIRSLSKVYPGGVSALKDVSLEISEGMYGLVGPNGAGKTTLMRIVAGLLEPSSGEVLLDGQDILSDPSRVWDRLGYLPQDFGFYPHLSGQAMLRHILDLKGIGGPDGTAATATQLMEAVNLAHEAKRRVKTYSGGMIQRLGIAQAIAGAPRLVIVDEPTAGLDPEERRRFYELLARMAADRIIILSTHIIEDVAVLCHRFAVIRKGEILARTTPSEARESIEGTVYEGEATGPEQEQEIRLSYRVLRAFLESGRRRLRVYLPEGPAPPGFHKAQPTLEDAYFVMVGAEEVPEQQSSVDA